MSSHARPTGRPQQAAGPARATAPALPADYLAQAATWGLTAADCASAGYRAGAHPRHGRALVIPAPTFRLKGGRLALDSTEPIFRPDRGPVKRAADGALKLTADGAPKRAKYLRADDSRPRLFLAHVDDLELLDDDSQPAYVVEGGPKGLKVRKALREAGLPGVVLHGCGIWTLIPKGADGRHRLNPDWYAFLRPGRRIVLIPDSDAEPEGTTAHAWGMVSECLAADGYAHSRTHLQNAADGSKVGPDDALVAGMTIEQLLATATPVEAVRRLEHRQADVLHVAAELRRLRHLPPSAAQVMTFVYQDRTLRGVEPGAFERCYLGAVAEQCGMSRASAWRALTLAKALGWIEKRHSRDRKTRKTILHIRAGAHWGRPAELGRPAPKPSAKRRTRGRIIPPAVRADLVCRACGAVGEVATQKRAPFSRVLHHPNAANRDHRIQCEHHTIGPVAPLPPNESHIEYGDRILTHPNAAKPAKKVREITPAAPAAAPAPPTPPAPTYRAIPNPHKHDISRHGFVRRASGPQTRYAGRSEAIAADGDSGELEAQNGYERRL